MASFFKKLLPYNEILGYAPGNIPAYSNHKDFSGESHVVDGVFMGYKWQCVEFARRWMVQRKGMIFGDVPTAALMWTELNSVRRMSDRKLFALKAYPNGGVQAPEAETLLIYARSRADPFGHVAVITEVVPGAVRIAEQNQHFHRWPGNFARELPLVEKSGGYWIMDRNVLGWLRIEVEN